MRAILFLNMGAPRNLDEVEIFLKNMFLDPNIIRVKSNLLRRFIATMITSFRAKNAKESYQELGGSSPLVAHTKELVKEISKRYPDDIVASVMRYTPDFAPDVICDLQAKGVDEVILFPLYPHYSTTTVKSSLEDFEEASRACDFAPKVRIVQPYYKEKSYNLSLIDEVKKSLHIDPSECELIFSAHSLPQKIVDQGDPYQQEVIEHTQILKALLQEEGLQFRDYHLAYQSKLGPVKWLEPSLEEKLKTLPNKKALVLPLSFTLDNSETDYELSNEYRSLAKEEKYDYYEVVTCPNHSPQLLDFIEGAIDAISQD